jgi:hypothetical protein
MRGVSTGEIVDGRSDTALSTQCGKSYELPAPILLRALAQTRQLQLQGFAPDSQGRSAHFAMHAQAADPAGRYLPRVSLRQCHGPVVRLTLRRRPVQVGDRDPKAASSSMHADVAVRSPLMVMLATGSRSSTLPQENDR